MCGPVAIPEESGKATCQFCYEEFPDADILREHLKGCKIRRMKILKIY